VADYRPKTATQWYNLGQLLIGAFAGLMSTPGIWISVGSPRRFLSWLLALSWAESRYEIAAYKEDEDAEGLLQYIGPTWEQFWPDADTRPSRLDPRAQGYTAALYVRDRTHGDPTLTWRLALPWRFGYAYFWRIWHWSPEAGIADPATIYAELDSAQSTAGDGTALGAFKYWYWISNAFVWLGLIPFLYVAFTSWFGRRG